MTNAERRERRRQAGLKGAETRRARQAQTQPTTATAPASDQADAFQQLADRINGYRPPEAPQPPRLETAEERARKEESADDRRRRNLRRLRGLMAEAHREREVLHEAWTRRYGWPKDWTPAQIQALEQWLRDTYRTPDGRWAHRPNRKGRA